MKTLTYAWRFLARSKAYTIINILGLSFSLACCLILMRYIYRELTVDTHCVDRNNVYAVIMDMEGYRGLLKSEMYDLKKDELTQAIENYIHFYNTKRYQFRLHCMTPMEYHIAFAA